MQKKGTSGAMSFRKDELPKEGPNKVEAKLLNSMSKEQRAAGCAPTDPEPSLVTAADNKRKR